MILGRVAGFTHKSDKLTARLNMTPHGPVFTSAWFATPKEAERIAAGAPIYLHLYGCHPATGMTVGEIPRDEDEKPATAFDYKPDPARDRIGRNANGPETGPVNFSRLMALFSRLLRLRPVSPG